MGICPVSSPIRAFSDLPDLFVLFLVQALRTPYTRPCPDFHVRFTSLHQIIVTIIILAHSLTEVYLIDIELHESTPYGVVMTF